MQNNLRIIGQQKQNKRLCRFLSVIIVVLILMSSAMMAVSAAITEESELGEHRFGLVVKQVDPGYFYSVDHSGINKDNWSIIRQRCYYSCQSLVTAFNNYIIETNYNKNIIKQIEYCYDHGYSTEAADLGSKYNLIRTHVSDALNDTKQLVGYSESSIPVVNGEEVTTEQYQNLYSIIANQFNELYSLAKEVSALYNSVKQEEDYKRTAGDNPAVNAINNSKSLTNRLWSLLGGVILDFGSGNSSASNFLGISVSSSSIEQTANKLSSIFKTLAYAVAVILFGVNITTTSLQNEILTLRGGVKVFARVILVKIWIDLAIPICIYVINIFNSITSQILTQFNVSSSGNILTNIFTNDFVYNTSNTSSGLEVIIGYIKSIFEAIKILLTGSPIIILFLVIAVCIVIVMVKMVARVFELTCLVAVSPVFFATLVGEESKRYFRKFISAFLSTAGYIVFVSITYIIATSWVAQSTPNTFVTFDPTVNLVGNFINVLPKAIIIIACCRVVVKPPKVLTSLLDG